MTATIMNMKFVYADLLTPSQLMEGDLINIDDEIVEVISVVQLNRACATCIGLVSIE